MGFSGFGPQKPDPNRTGTGRFGPAPVRFGFFFLTVWLFFKGKNQTEPKMITPTSCNGLEPSFRAWTP
jgi:hypothetical protein